MTVSTPDTGDARRVVVSASLSFGGVLLVAGVLVLWLAGRHPLSVFDAGAMAVRAITGAVAGTVAALSCVAVVRRLPALAALRRRAGEAVEGIEPRWHTMVAVALAAGISEEYFFRGALEPLIGPVFAAIAFAALHGALRIRDRGAILFAVFLLLASFGLSALNRWRGLECAMAAHTAYDLVMFAWLARGLR